jgi:hypothetical protein
MKDNGKVIVCMDEEEWIGLMEAGTMDTGKWECNME